MKIPAITAGSLTAATVLAIGMTVGGFGVAAAQPIDFGALPVNPNVVTDSTAWLAESPVQNPNGQPGVEAVYTHRDSTRKITDTILVLPDPAAAIASIGGSQAELANTVVNAKTQLVPVGTGGTILTGTSPDGTASVTVLTFTEGNAATTIEFTGSGSDPAPTDLVIELGQKQAAAIKDALSA